MAGRNITFDIYTDKSGKTRFRIMSGGGGHILAASQGYTRKSSAIKTTETIKREAEAAEVRDKTS